MQDPACACSRKQGVGRWGGGGNVPLFLPPGLCLLCFCLLCLCSKCAPGLVGVASASGLKSLGGALGIWRSPRLAPGA